MLRYSRLYCHLDYEISSDCRVHDAVCRCEQLGVHVFVDVLVVRYEGTCTCLVGEANASLTDCLALCDVLGGFTIGSDRDSPVRLIHDGSFDGSV